MMIPAAIHLAGGAVKLFLRVEPEASGTGFRKNESFKRSSKETKQVTDSPELPWCTYKLVFA